MHISRNLSLVLLFSFFLCTSIVLGFSIFNLHLHDEMLPPDAPQKNETMGMPQTGIDMNICLIIYWVFIGVGIFGIVYLIILRRGREVLHAFLGAFLAILIIIGMLYIMMNTQSTDNNQLNNTTSGSNGTPGNTPSARTTNSPPVISVIMVIAMFVIIAIIAISIIFSYIGGRSKRGIGKPLLVTDFARAIDESIAIFETGVSSRDAIIRCYKRLTEILAAHGVKDALYLTPREFREEVRIKMNYESKHLDTLISLFETARYSTHEIDDAQRTTAVNALKAIRSEVGK